MFSMIVAAFVLIATFGIHLSGPAVAADCTAVSSVSACEAANTAARAGAYRGPRAETRQEMVCLYALYDRATELVLADGPKPTGPALLRWRASAINWQRWSRDPTLVAGEICIPMHLIQNQDAVTLCNGTSPGAGNHSTWRRKHINQLVYNRRINEHDPACLLGSARCARYGL